MSTHWGITLGEIFYRQHLAAMGENAMLLCFEVDGDSLSVTGTEDLSDANCAQYQIKSAPTHILPFRQGQRRGTDGAYRRFLAR